MKTLKQSEIKPTKEEEEMEEKMVILRQEEGFNQQEEAIIDLTLQINNQVQVTQEVTLIEANLRSKEEHKEAVQVKKWCDIHDSTTHSTKDCYQNKSRVDNKPKKHVNQVEENNEPEDDQQEEEEAANDGITEDTHFYTQNSKN